MSFMMADATTNDVRRVVPNEEQRIDAKWRAPYDTYAAMWKFFQGKMRVKIRIENL